MLYDDMSRLPDHPVIRNMETFGTPDGSLDKEPELRCPICGSELCDTIYRRRSDEEIVGCDICLEPDTAADSPECYPDDGYDPRPECRYDI